jgi:cold shock CspA family protein
MGNGQKDLFFHLRNLSNVRFDELQVGDSMEFDVATGEKGPFAENVVRVEE